MVLIAADTSPLRYAVMAEMRHHKTPAIVREWARKLQSFLIDDRDGVRMARLKGFRVTGTLGVLEEYARSGFITIDDALARVAARSGGHLTEKADRALPNVRK